MANGKKKGQTDAPAAQAPSMLDAIRSQVDNLSPEEIRSAIEALQARKEKQKEYRVKREAKLTPEQKAARKAKAKERAQDPAVKARQKEYRERPDVKERAKRSRLQKAERTKAILARAKELGIV